MKFRSNLAAGCALLALSCGIATGAELAGGAAACKSQLALQEYNQAVTDGDLNTVDWLRSAACMVAPHDYDVQVLEETPTGEVRVSALIQRRSATLWISSTSLNP